MDEREWLVGVGSTDSLCGHAQKLNLADSGTRCSGGYPFELARIERAAHTTELGQNRKS